WTYYAHSGDVQESGISTYTTRYGEGINAVEDAKAEELLELTDTVNLELWTEPGVPTGMNAVSQTTIDLVLASHKLQARLIACAVSEDTHADSDHMPIVTQIDLSTQCVEEARRRCWKVMDTKKFLEFVSANLLGKRGDSRGESKGCRQGGRTPPQCYIARGTGVYTLGPAISMGTTWFPPISEQEVINAIRRAPPDKAPGPDELPNRVWKLLLACKDFTRILTTIFDTCIRTGYNPRHFQQSITVVLRKGGPRDFRKPKSY
ncbi:hypothetical protein N7495_003428, partial [Penicillium taxi]|uniref:uncharacterized protein n=1 Tax=Penicillium taxi TaxID=168475 RepID=UPI0025457DB4